MQMQIAVVTYLFPIQQRWSKKISIHTASMDTGFGYRGVSGKGNARYEGNSNCRTSYSYSGETYNGIYYTTAYYESAVVGIRTSDGRCMVKYNLGGRPYNMTRYWKNFCWRVFWF